MDKISAFKAAKLLNISVDHVVTLEEQGLIHSSPSGNDSRTYSFEEIDRFKKNKHTTLADEAAIVEKQIEREVVDSVSQIKKFLRRLFLLSVVLFGGFIFSVFFIAVLFRMYPQQLSDFFGYYYRFNDPKNSSVLGASTGRVLQAQIGPEGILTQTSIIADVLKPIANTSLVVVKAIDGQQYQQIVTQPAQQGVSGQSGADGENGIDGADGRAGDEGRPGASGQQGIPGSAGSAGANGTNGQNGQDGVNGTSVADILTTSGDIMIRNISNVSTRLAAGVDGQVLTITGGVPSWATTNGLTVSNFSSANISQWANNTGYITSASADTITNKTLSASTNTILGITNSNLSGSAGITNANLANSSVTLSTLGPLGGGGAVSLGAGLTLSCVTCLVSGDSLFTTIASSGSNSTISQGGVVSLIAGSNITTTNNGSGGITFATSATPTFTSINGLTISNTGSNTLTIAAGKTFAVNNSVTFTAIDGTTFALPSFTDTLVGRTSSDVLTNKTISASSNTISGLVNANLSGSAGITNTNLANSLLTVASGTGLIGGGSVSLGSSTTLNIGAGNGITSNADDIAVNLTSSGTTGSTSSNSGLEVSSAGLTLLKGCSDGQMLKYADAGGWACANDLVGSDLQHAVSRDTNEALQNITSSQTILGTVSVTPSTARGDVYVVGQAEVFSSNGTDQPFTLVIETTNNCTGLTVGNASVTYTITSGASTSNTKGVLIVSGIAVDPGASSQVYSLCASTSAGDTDVQNWRIEALVIDTGADLAEIYTTNDRTIEAGDVVSLDPTLKAGMKKSQTVYDPTILGIVATKPGLVIGGADKEGVNALPVTLSGRVPVKVSMENGEIQPGDYLTSSSIPGVAMKATKDGVIIGTAMEGYSHEGIGVILTFVKNSYSLQRSFEKDQDVPKTIEKNNNASAESNILEIANNLLKNLVEFYGNVIFHADVSFLGRTTFNNDSAGFAVVDAGAHEVTISFDKEYQNIPVVIGSPDTAILYAITNVSTKGFTIRLIQVEESDIKFSWSATAVRDVKTSVGTSPTSIPEAGAPESSGIPNVNEPSAPSVMQLDLPSTTPSATASSSAHGAL